MTGRAASGIVLCLLLVSAVSAARGIAQATTSLEWDVFYSADNLPNHSEPQWILMETFPRGCADDTEVARADGILHLDTTAEDEYWYYYIDTEFDNMKGLVVEFNLWIESYPPANPPWPGYLLYEVFITICDGTKVADFCFLPGNVTEIKSGLQYCMDTTDDYHIYTFWAKGNDFRLYVDGVLAIDGTGEYTKLVPENRVYFGDVCGVHGFGNGAISHWDYVAYKSLAEEGKTATKVYFKMSPNPAGVGENIVLEGLLIDEYYNPLRNETVEIYVRLMEGTWHHVITIVTDEYGLFIIRASVPRTMPTGKHLVAVYYPGSEAHRPCYNIKVLIVQ